MRKIDLSEWNQTGGGAVGMSYFHKTDQSLMLKFMNPDTKIENIEKELANSRNVYDLGLPTPRPGELVTDGTRMGIVFERIAGKRSFAKMIGDEPENIDNLAVQFARITKQLHSTPCNKSNFKSVKQLFGEMIKANPFRENLKEKALNLLDSMPDSDTCLHGDLHFGNIIQSGDGHNYLIDLLDFCYGYYMFDFGAISSLLKAMVPMENIFYREYHCSIAQATQFWITVQKEYFGQDTDLEALDQKIRPFTAIKTLCMETESNICLPDVSANEIYSVLGDVKL